MFTDCGCAWTSTQPDFMSCIIKIHRHGRGTELPDEHVSEGSSWFVIVLTVLESGLPSTSVLKLGRRKFGKNTSSRTKWKKKLECWSIVVNFIVINPHRSRLPEVCDKHV